MDLKFAYTRHNIKRTHQNQTKNNDTINKSFKKYNDNVVLDIDSLTISDGESFGLVGNNGAGKTTMFRLILDLIKRQPAK